MNDLKADEFVYPMVIWVLILGDCKIVYINDLDLKRQPICELGDS